MTQILDKVKTALAAAGNSELSTQQKVESLKDIFDQKQELIAEMNKAKRQAMEDAQKPYLEAIKKIDEEYALILTLVGVGK